MKNNFYIDIKNNKSFRIEAVISILILACVLFGFTRLLSYNEIRTGFAFQDPLLVVFSPIDVTWLTFSVIYGCLAFAVFILYRDPENLLLAIKSYTVLLILRMFTLYLLPLLPPTDMILLKDPFVEVFASSGKTLTRDLFFSGHTSMLFLLYLVIPNKNYKIIFLIAAIVVGICVLIQHVHYSIDVFAAPVFSYAAFKLAFRINSINKNSIKH